MKPEIKYCENSNHDRRLCVASIPIDVHPDGLGAALLEAMRKNSTSVAQIDGETGRIQSYGELLSESIRIAKSLQANGLQPGDIVCFCSMNSLQCHAAVIATYLAGGIFTALDPIFCTSETTQFLKLLEPKFVFCDEPGLNLIEETLKDCNVQTKIICFSETSKYIQFSEMLVCKMDENSFEAWKPKSVHDTVAIFFSSGSTGTNKGICNSHYNILKSCQERTGTYVYYPVTRLCWISASLIYTASIMTGSSWVVSREYNVKDIFRLIEKHQVTCLIISLLHAYHITKNPECIGDTSSLIGCCLTGSRVSADLILSLRKLLPNTVVLQGYGLTEASGMVMVYTEDDLNFIQSKPGSIGHAVTGCCAKVVDIETEKKVDGPNKTGELRIKLDKMFTEYYKNPEVTAEAFDSEGYYCTGDIVYYDEDYYFYFVDRIKEMMKYRSFYVYPLELESVLMNHPDISEAVVISIPHDEDMEHPMGVVKLVEGATTAAEEIQEYVDSQLVDYKQLRGGIKIVDEIPITGSFKLRRRVIRDMILKGEI